MIETARPAALLAAALALVACGGGVEKEALVTYEASVEKLMEEEGKVSARLLDLREDLLSDNAASEEMISYARTVASPFYARFQEAAARAPAEAERLAKVHALLVRCLDERVAYLAAIESFLGASKGEAMDRLRRTQGAWDAAVAELVEKTGGQLPDAGAADAIRRRTLFMKAKYEPFQGGRLPVEEVEEALRNEVLPRLQKVAERSKANLAAEGVPGAIARWAAAELAFFQELAATLPLQVAIQKSALASKKAWDAAAEDRDQYLSGLRAYRDSLR